MDNSNNIIESDYIIVFAGTNDIAREVELGTIDDNVPTTFYGALNKICTQLIYNYPDKHICFFTPYARNAGIVDLFKCKQYVTAIEEVCEKHSIPVFNNIKNGGVDWSNYIQTQSLTMNDTYHLNEAGHTRAMYKYEAFLKKL